MQPPKNQKVVLKYNIFHKEDGVLLCMWEPAPLTEMRVKPFLYMVRQRVESEAEAMDLLNQYLSAYSE
jgi:hypothetical protein